MLSGHTLRNRYKIIKLLGSGSFGITYLAEDLDLPDHPLCVVKSLRQSQSPEELQAFIAFFNKEAKALYRLGDKYNQIPRLFAHFEEGGEFYLVQEYIDGHDLSQEIFSGNKLSEAKVTQLLKEILEVLTIIHNQNIIHRDIKAQNLMRRNSDEKIVLIDFGTVKEISQSKANPQEQTNASVVIGTYGYMPSEQLNGYPKLSSDVYAVGMLGIYALTGIRPQELPKDPDTFEVIWRDQASVSPFLANVLDKMIRSNFKERYQTAGDALQALIVLLPYSNKTFFVINQKIIISVGAVMTVILGIGLLYMIRSAQSVCLETNPSKAPDRVDIDGYKYYGKLVNDKYQGCGTLILKGGTAEKYVGEFNEGKYHGQGTIINRDGTSYIGQFKNNHYDGKGTYVFKDGRKYIGDFKDNVFDGRGSCISQDGSSENGIWDKGVFKGAYNTRCIGVQ